PSARRPCSGTLTVQHALGDADLLGARGLRRIAGAAVGAPCARAELQPAVEAVAGVDMPVAAGLALGHTGPIVSGSDAGAERERHARGGAHREDGTQSTGESGRGHGVLLSPAGLP